MLGASPSKPYRIAKLIDDPGTLDRVAAFLLASGYEGLLSSTPVVSIFAEGASMPARLRAFCARECGKIYYSVEGLLASPSSRLILESLSRGLG